ncbi:MAG TPA: MFS transporter [Chloroflexota bacterium]|nr:MFS transporter [Chloroflexota bacterium]
MVQTAAPAASGPAEPTPGGPAERARLLAALTVLHTINDFYGLVLPPLLPALREAFQLSYGQLGVVPFVGAAVSSLLQPTLGYAADRRRTRRLFMTCGFVGYALAMLCLGSAGSYPVVLLAAALLGVASSTYHPQSATFLVHYFQANRGVAQGVHGLGNGFGFLLAPLAVSLLVPTLGWPNAVRLLALPALLAALLAGSFLREPPFSGGEGFFAGVTRPVVVLTAVTGLGLAGSFGFLVWLPSYYAAQGFSLTQAGLLTSAMVAAGLAAQPAGGSLSDRFGRRAVILLSLVGAGAFQLLFLASHLLPLVVALSLLAGFFGSLLPPVAMVYASELAAGGRTGTAVGVVWGLGISLSSVAPLLSGAVIDRYGFVAAYLGLSVVALAAAVLALRLPDEC